MSLDRLKNVIKWYEDFDGTLSDLGQVPTAPLGIVDARGGSRKLSGKSSFMTHKDLEKYSKRKSNKKNKKTSK